MLLCKTDTKTIIRYLDDAAKVYDQRPGLRNASRAYMIRKLIHKLNHKLEKENEIL